MINSSTKNSLMTVKTERVLQKLLKKRQKAFLYGWTNRMIKLDKKISELKKQN